MLTGTTRPYRPLLWVHIALAAAGAVVLVVRAVTGAFEWLPKRTWIRELAILAFAAAALTPAFRYHADLAPNGGRIVNPKLPPLSMDGEGAGPHSPFFPSSADTDSGKIIPANFFMTSATCGKCHKDIYDQWNSSAHHFSSFNNQWYRKSIEYMQDVVGTKPSKWCAGCHDHAVFFNGRFDRPIKEQIDTPEAQNGLGCTSCHSIVHVRSTMGQGDFEIEYPPLHDLAVSENPVLAWTHDYLLKLDPAPHRKVFLKHFHREQTAEFCSSCHKVHLDVPVNDYRWFRGFNDYDNWQASGMSGQGARSFYYPPKPQKCADCHMPLVASNDPVARDGKVKSHRFPAANTALPFVNDDHEQLRITQEFLKDGVVSVDVFGLVPGEEPARRPKRSRPSGGEPRLASTFAVGEEGGSLGASQTVLRDVAPIIAPLDKVDAALRRGESVRVEVVVRTRKIGHFFPGGTVDAFDVWVELEAVDSNGKTIFHSGEVTNGGKGPVDPGAHLYRSLLLDEHGNPINKRNAWAARSVAYVRLIPPGAADTIHYRLRIPEDCGDKITLRAKVNYRKFAWWNTQWAFAGVRDPAVKDVALAGLRRRPVGLHRRHRQGLGPDQGDPRPAHHGDGRDEGRAADPAQGGARAGAQGRPRPVGARALERLRHRPAAAGRPARRRGGVPEGDRDGAGLRRRLRERGAGRGSRKATWPRPRRTCGRRSRSTRSSPRRTSSSARRSRRSAATTRRSSTRASRSPSTRATAW